MITAMQSGGGKTVMTCGLMRALQRRGLSVQGFKSGPDYIDPMFHSLVLGVPSRNLDLFLQGEGGVRATLSGGRGDVAVLEGAMGFYDGLAGTDQVSPWRLAEVTDTPAILVLRPGGQSLTLAAQVRGLMEFRSPSHIRGLLLTDTKPGLYDYLRPILERETDLPVLGFLPPMEEARLPSRHLGLVTAGEIPELSARFDAVAAALEANVELDRLLEIGVESEDRPVRTAPKRPAMCRIAVARDQAFSFYYEDNLETLRDSGAELVFFSPVSDESLPEADGLYLGGGYPELSRKELSANVFMRRSILEAVQAGMPTVAECGGFLYLQKYLRDKENRQFPMAGALPGEGYPTDRLQRFGYVTLRPETDSLLFRAGEQIPAHEFHYWDCTDFGIDLMAEKANGKQWRCGYVSESLYAAFPHLHFRGPVPLAERFVRAAIRYKERQK